MNPSKFTVRVLTENPHKAGTQIWKAGQIVTGMEGCRIDNIIRALTALEADTFKADVGNPPRWLTHFAGLESAESGKAIEAWIEIVHEGEVVRSTSSYRELLNLLNI